MGRAPAQQCRRSARGVGEFSETAIGLGYALFQARESAFSTEFFDFIGCDLLINHTSDTHLLRYFAPGALLASYVCRKKGTIPEFVCERTTRMSGEDCLKFSEMTHLGRALSDLKATVELPVDMPPLSFQLCRHDVQRFFYWNVIKCHWKPGVEWPHELRLVLSASREWQRADHRAPRRPGIQEHRPGSKGGLSAVPWRLVRSAALQPDPPALPAASPS